jgi:Ca2+-binding RTX toxin-like protein
MANYITGTAAANILNGTAGNDIIFGLEGDDRLNGGKGNDVLVGGEGADIFVLARGEGFDAVADADGTDIVVATGGPFFDLDWSYRDGADLVVFLPDEHNYEREPANAIRILNHFAGSSILYVEADVALNNANFGVDADLARVYLAGTTTGINQGDHGEIVFGADDPASGDTILGNGGYFDSYFGLGGDDSIVSGGARFATFNGGDGDDTMVGGDAFDGRDVFRGSQGRDIYQGGLGVRDRLDLRDGDVGVRVDLAKAGFQYVSGWEGSDQITGIEDVYGSRFNDVLTGNAGDNVLVGRDGRDVLDGRGSNDTMEGGQDNDTYVVDSIGDLVREVDFSLGGTDHVRSSITYTLPFLVERLTLTGNGATSGTGNVHHNLMTGNGAANTLDGQYGSDTLIGGAGNDQLIGGANDSIDGADRLYGGLGADQLTGGGGNDRFDYHDIAESGLTVAARDRILDFTVGATAGQFVDRIDLRDIDADASTAALDAFAFINKAAFTAAGQVRWVVAGADVTVEVNTGGTLAADMRITLVNFAGTLEAVDFML